MVAHSFTGIDARAAISMFGAGQRVSSLTTISSPHLGMKLVDRILAHGYLDGVSNLERVFDILGICKRSALEFSTHNLADFNQVCPNSKSTKYYSIGAKKNGRIMNPMLKDGHTFIVNDTLGVQCDGLVQDIEARWGEYLITFENDHLELVGFQPEHNPANVMNLVADNSRLSEIRGDPSLSFEYGVSHL